LIGDNEVMSVREELHRLVDTLPEDQVQRLLHELQDTGDEPLTSADIAAVDRGLGDLRAGRSITLDDLKAKYGV
jgi:hypothetical protein